MKITSGVFDDWRIFNLIIIFLILTNSCFGQRRRVVEGARLSIMRSPCLSALVEGLI